MKVAAAYPPAFAIVAFHCTAVVVVATAAAYLAGFAWTAFGSTADPQTFANGWTPAFHHMLGFVVPAACLAGFARTAIGSNVDSYLQKFGNGWTPAFHRTVVVAAHFAG